MYVCVCVCVCGATPHPHHPFHSFTEALLHRSHLYLTPNGDWRDYRERGVRGSTFHAEAEPKSSLTQLLPVKGGGRGGEDRIL